MDEDRASWTLREYEIRLAAAAGQKSETVLAA